MNKTYINELTSNMKKAGIVTKSTPWLVEGFGEKQMNVRYVGIKPADEWLKILSEKNNLMIKFIFDKSSSYLELYLANKPPFIKIAGKTVTENDKWEVILGNIRRRLNQDKADFTNHTEKAGNLYTLIRPHLK